MLFLPREQSLADIEEEYEFELFCIQQDYYEDRLHIAEQRYEAQLAVTENDPQD
jgi:hypothetical protein